MSRNSVVSAIYNLFFNLTENIDSHVWFSFWITQQPVTDYIQQQI